METVKLIETKKDEKFLERWGKPLLAVTGLVIVAPALVLTFPLVIGAVGMGWAMTQGMGDGDFDKMFPHNKLQDFFSSDPFREN